MEHGIRLARTEWAIPDDEENAQATTTARVGQASDRISQMKRLIAFDLDGTLAESKQPISQATAELLSALLGVATVAVISGGDWPQFETQVVSRLPRSAALQNLFILPTTGTKLYRFDNGWQAIYADIFTPHERRRIGEAIDAAIDGNQLHEKQIWGDRVEDRGSQITFSGLGQLAPLAAKTAWDPDFAKRKLLQLSLRRMLPDLSVNIGGSTSIDITRQGIDKAYGMRKLAEHTGIPFSAMLFFGDAIYPGGNDDPVREAGIDTIAVRDPAETNTALLALIAFTKP
jgi:phosphomannomutase